LVASLIVLGPWMNVYNEDTLKFLAAKGAYHASLPAELYKDSIAVLGEASKKLGVALEVQVFGRIPLALSARCYHARAHQLSKDNCQFVCEKDPDGMLLNTLGGQQFLAINGIQTLSDTYLNLAGELEELQAMGVSYFRLSPHSNDMVETANVFNRLIERKINAAEASNLIQATGDVEPFSNGFYHHQPGHKWLTAS
jgi:collagenase-like PrtC family protease